MGKGFFLNKTSQVCFWEIIGQISFESVLENWIGGGVSTCLIKSGDMLCLF